MKSVIYKSEKNGKYNEIFLILGGTNDLMGGLRIFLIGRAGYHGGGTGLQGGGGSHS